jgi:hypothetical protein
MQGGRDDDDVPRWVPPPAFREARRSQPPVPASTRQTPHWHPPAGSSSRRRTPRPGAPSVRRRSAAPTDPPLVRWRARLWLVAWGLMLAIPPGAVLLRLLDGSGHGLLGVMLGAGFAASLAVALILALLASAHRSAGRAAVGVSAALATGGVLLWLVTSTTLGRSECPGRAGADRGLPTAVAALAAWRQGGADAAWLGGQPQPGWLARAGAAGLLDYQLVGSGCWERLAPIDVSRTWHEFRVTVRRGEEAPLSKVVVVHTALAGEGWKITGIDGPLP